MTVLLGRGMDAADKKTQTIKLQAEMSHLGARKEKALAELGRALLMQEGGNPALMAAFPDQIRAIEDLETQEEALRQRIDALQNSSVLSAIKTTNTVAQEYSCPACGSSVTLDTMFCPNCGDNLAVLKSQFRRCPNCDTYYPSDALFCEKCGSRTEDLVVAKTPGMPVVQESHVDAEASPNAVDSVETSNAATDVQICQKCGAPIVANASFCGKCGSPL